MSNNNTSNGQSLVKLNQSGSKIPYYITKNQRVGKLIVVYGPMFSEKTTKIIKLINTYLTEGLKVVLIRSLIDTRTKGLKTHDGYVLLNELVLTIQTSTIDHDIIKKIEEFDAIIIDEGQFFDKDELQNLYQLLVVNSNKTFVVSGLITNKDLVPYPSIRDLLPFADKTYQRVAHCKICQRKKAIFTKLLETNQNVAGDDKFKDSFVKIGGDDLYHSLCRTCLKTLETSNHQKITIHSNYQEYNY